MSSKQNDVIGDAWKRFQKASENKYGLNSITILGGKFTPSRLNDFLDVWRERWDNMSYRIWEHISQIEFANEPKTSKHLQRAELFGEGGHLSMRRDGNRWFWHYIGPAKEPIPKGFTGQGECEDFWAVAENANLSLRCYEEQVLLWGEDKKSKGFWWEDRVAAAKLNYPISEGGRVCLKFWRFTENGRTAFVWYRGLEKMTTEEGKKEEASNDSRKKEE